MALWGKTDTLASAPKWLTKSHTFDGSANTVVDVDADTITIVGHGLATGTPVTYTAGNTEIAGLTSDTIYYAIRVDADTISLAANTSDAEAGTAIDLTAVGDDTDTIQITPSNLYFVDITEVGVAANQARGFTQPGWWTYTTYTDSDSKTRHRAVCLAELSVTAVAAGDVGVDGSDDAVVADS